jgi:hypothetical protein
VKAEEPTTLGDTTRLFADEVEPQPPRTGLTTAQAAVSLAAEFAQRAKAIKRPGGVRQSGLRDFFQENLDNGVPVEELEKMLEYFFISPPPPISDVPLWRAFIATDGATRLHNVATQRITEKTRAAKRAEPAPFELSGSIPKRMRKGLEEKGII